MNTSEMHRGSTARTAGQSKQVDSCARPWQDMPASTRASLAKEMHAPRLGGGACIPCMLQLTVSRPPNRTLINHYSIQVFQSAQEKVPGTQAINPSAQDSHDARISQAKRCNVGCTGGTMHASLGSQRCTLTACYTRQWG